MTTSKDQKIKNFQRLMRVYKGAWKEEIRKKQRISQKYGVLVRKYIALGGDMETVNNEKPMDSFESPF